MTLAPYTTIKTPAEAEFVEKKSRFIGRLYPAASLEEAQGIIDAVKKQYHDATHNCSAAITGKRGEYTRCSDDGEPQGTAGVPMLEALMGTGLTDTVAIVTRYFGGTLLGTGGLVRAYTKAVQLAANAATIVTFEPWARFDADFSFKAWGRIEAALHTFGCEIAGVEYGACVSARLYVPDGRQEAFKKLVSELTSGTVFPADGGVGYIERTKKETPKATLS